MELLSCHPFDAENLEVSSRFLGKFVELCLTEIWFVSCEADCNVRTKSVIKSASVQPSSEHSTVSYTRIL